MKLKKPKVFVTDAQMRSSLAVIRSLGRKGLEVTGGEETRFTTGFFSKFCEHSVVYPTTKKDEDKFVTYMKELVNDNEYDVIFPMTDDTVIPIVKHKKEFSKHTIVPFPDYEILVNAIDKSKTLRVAMENGIPCPETHFINTLSDLEEIRNNLSYPIIIKPAKGYGARGVALCKSEEDLEHKSKEVFATHGPLLAQEYIPHGDELGVYALFNFDSEPRAVTVQRRIRSYPVSGGPSTLRESIKNPKLVEIAFKLLKILDWQGVAMVEFRVDPRDNTPKLMEINPRFWGSLQLSIFSGVDFPYLLYKLVTEGDIEPVMDYKRGVKCRWMLPGDIFWFLSAPNKIGNLREFCRFRTNYDIISLEDPGPTFGFMLATVRYLFDREMWKFIIRKPLDEDVE
jgi:predicted ATP-grasp superfamily ATP-dependent carboligase